MEPDPLYHPHRLFLDTQTGLPPSQGKRTSDYYYSSDTNFDSNMVIVLAALLCSLVCALGLNSIVRCALRCRYRVSSDTPEQAVPRLAATTGVKKSSLNQIPVVAYESGENTWVTDCLICLGEFSEGEKVRVMPNCKHGFHVKCIDKWLLSHSSCPLCRQPLIDESSNAEEVNGEV